MPQTPAQRAWYERNSVRLRAKAKARYEANRVAILAQQKEQRGAETEAERATRRAYHRAYYAQHGERLRAGILARHHARTPEQREADNRTSANRRRGDPKTMRQRNDEQRAVRDAVIDGYGGICACCGTNYRPHLTLDHINENGADRRRGGEWQGSEYRRLRRLLAAGERDPDYQVLCWNCNIAKHRLGRCACSDACHQRLPAIAFVWATASA